MPGALLEPVRRDGESEAAERRCRPSQVEAAQPGIDDEPGGDDRREQEQVPGDDRSEERVEGPEKEAERPTSEHRLRLDERLKAVRVRPRYAAVLQPVADEPEAIDGLEVVSGRRLACPEAVVRHELAGERPDRGPRRGDGRGGVKGGQESERAAESNSSKSGNC